LVASVHLEQNTLKSTALGADGITVASKDGRGAQELSHGIELLAQCLLGGLSRISNGVITDSFELRLMRLDKRSLLSSQTVLVLGSELLVVANLLLSLRNGGLKGRLLKDLGLLVVVDLLLFNQVIKRLVGVFGDDGIDFAERVLVKKTATLEMDQKKQLETKEHSIMTHQLLHGIAKCPKRGIQLAHFHLRIGNNHATRFVGF
jgi:hypothetical protein